MVEMPSAAKGLNLEVDEGVKFEALEIGFVFGGVERELKLDE